MRYCRTNWCSLTRGAGLAALLVTLAAALTASADRFPPDPVEDLRQALKSTLREPAVRERAITKKAEALRTLSDLRRALTLQEWKDDDPDQKIADVDLPVRKKVADRFEQG